MQNRATRHVDTEPVPVQADELHETDVLGDPRETPKDDVQGERDEEDVPVEHPRAGGDFAHVDPQSAADSALRRVRYAGGIAPPPWRSGR